MEEDISKEKAYIITRFFLHPEDGGSTVIQNIIIHLPNYTASQHRKP
jgi:hypothetical protein